MPHFLGSKEPLQYLGVPETNPPDVFERDRAPVVTDDSTLYNLGDIWIDTSSSDAYVLTDRTENAAMWVMLGAAAGSVNTLTGDIGGAISPSASNINIQGGAAGAISFSNGGVGQMDALVLVDGVTVTIVGNALTAPGGITSFPVDNGGPGVPSGGSLSIVGSTSTDFTNASGIETHVGATTDEIYLENRRFVSAFIVDPSSTIGLRGEYTTITAAVTAASAAGGGDVYIRRGVYVEGFTLPASVTLIGLTAGTDVPFVEIQGTIVINAAGNYAMKDLTINPGAGPALTVTSATLLELDNVVIDPAAGLGAQFQSAAATTLAQQCTFNSLASDAIQVTNGILTLDNCIITNEVDVSGTSTVNMNYCSMTGITLLTGTPTLTSTYTSHDGAASEAFNLGVGTTLNLFHGNVTSTDAGGEWVIGTGTINYADVIINGTATNLAAGLTITNPDWKPYGDTVGVVGVNSYNPLQFSVNSTSGQVSLLGGGQAIDEINVDSISGTGTNPVLPDAAGAVTFTAAQVAASAFANVININSSLPNQYEAQIQRSSAVAVADTTVNGVSHFDNTQFTVDSDGFVQSLSSGVFSWVDSAGGVITVNTGTFATAAAVFTLPTGAANGETVEIVDVVGGGVILTAAGVQIIQIQASASSAGGTSTSTSLGDNLRLKFRLADVTWYSTSTGGSWTLA